jgi:3-dehydro-4-phosphotetronate decarboxylase
MNQAELIQQLRDAGREMVESDLTWGNAGNVSHRLEGERCLISASGTNLGRMEVDDWVDCSLNDEEAYSRRPSKELPMHAAVYRQRPEIQAVLHGAPFYATLAACSDLELPGNLFVENIYYLERVGRVPYHHPGSSALAQAVEEKASTANILLLENHGVLVYDTSLAEAMMALRTLEIVSRMVLEARQAGVSFKSLPESVAQDFLHNSGYRPPRRWK